MRVLLDTNIIIHRENNIVTNNNIGLLYNWLDKSNAVKLIHQYTFDELYKYNNKEKKELYDVKLQSYTKLQTIASQSQLFIEALKDGTINKNDEIDNQLLYETYCGRVDYLITEDKNLLRKSIKVGIDSKVLSINDFIELQTSLYPDLVTYKNLSVKTSYFGNIDHNDIFFDSLKGNYDGFSKWFNSKCDEKAYVCKDENGKFFGFLYLKVEDEYETYSDITPILTKCKRLKVGTFKVETTGFRLGERFLKIIFDNAITQNVDEIYVTLFEDDVDVARLRDLFFKWGFILHGYKGESSRKESVLIKRMNYYNNLETPKFNFPNVNYNTNLYYLPIKSEYHTRLLPDSIIRGEQEFDFINNSAEKYSLEKCYISFCYKRNLKIGDVILLYRNGETPGRKGFESIVSTIGVVSDIFYDFKDIKDFKNKCGNRTVFSDYELDYCWKKKDKIIIKFLMINTLQKKVTLNKLWDEKILIKPTGPRPLDELSKENFNKIIELSYTKLYNMK